MDPLLSKTPFSSETLDFPGNWVIGQNQERAGEDKTQPWNRAASEQMLRRKYNASNWNTSTSTLRPSNPLIHSFHFFLSSYPVPGTEAVQENSSESASLGGAHSLVNVATNQVSRPAITTSIPKASPLRKQNLKSDTNSRQKGKPDGTPKRVPNQT